MNFLLKPLRALFGGKPAGAPPRAPGDGAAAVHGAPAAAACSDDSGAAASPIAQRSAGEAVELQHLWSDEPNAIKLQISRTLLPFGEQRTYRSRDEAADSPLAQAIFEAGGIESVTLESVYITAMMEADADWEAILQRLPGMISKFFAAGGEPFAGSAVPGKRYKFGFKQVQSRPREEQIQIVQELFDKEVNPAVAAHGGYFNLLDVKDNTVYVELGGGCQGCGMANVTLRQGVEERLRQVLPEMAALVDTTDHAAGTNPYYQQSKK